MARVLVVGATGYLGSHMVTELKAAGHWVRALSRRKGAFDGATRAPDEVFVGQATRRETLDGLCDGIDYVFSALGQTRQKDKQSFWDVDYGANKAVLHLAVAAGVKQFLFISVIQPELSADLDIVAAREALVRDMAAAPIPHTVVRATGFFSDMGEFLDMAKGGRVWLVGRRDGSDQPGSRQRRGPGRHRRLRHSDTCRRGWRPRRLLLCPDRYAGFRRPRQTSPDDPRSRLDRQCFPGSSAPDQPPPVHNLCLPRPDDAERHPRPQCRHPSPARDLPDAGGSLTRLAGYLRWSVGAMFVGNRKPAGVHRRCRRRAGRHAMPGSLLICLRTIGTSLGSD